MEALRTQIRSSAVSLTSVPKALKYLRNQYSKLVSIYENTLSEGEDSHIFANILSVIAMTQHEDISASRDTLKYHLKGQRQGSIADWGHEYVRHLSMELMSEFNDDSNSEEFRTSKLVPLAVEIANFHLDHNGEPDACDLLYEIGKLDLLVELASHENRDHERVCLYLLSCVPYEADGDDRMALRVAHCIYRKVEDYPHSLVLALRLGEADLVREDFCACPDSVIRKQLAYILARQNFRMDEELLSRTFDADEVMELSKILNNTNLTDSFKTLAKELEILEPRTPDDIYKSHLQDSLRVAPIPSPKINLAAVFVNGFVNAGFGTDKLVGGSEVEAEESRSWIYRVKDHGVLSAVASIGLLHLWDADTGLGKLDRYLYSENPMIKAGAVLGIGLVHAGIKNESDPALALLREYLEDQPDEADMESSTANGKKSQSLLLKESALMGLAIAYGGSARRDVIEPVIPLISHDNLNVATMAALALGHIFVGSCDGDLASVILQTLMERDAKALDESRARFFALGLALIYLGRTETEAQVILETLAVIEHRLARDAEVLVKICSYAGSGNVLKIQELLHLCVENRAADAGLENATAGNEPSDDRLEDPASVEGTAYAVIGVSLICMMEDIGKEMSHRIFTHLMHYGSPSVRKAVPLAIGLLYASHPVPQVLDILSKYSHDADKATAVASVFALGLVGGGTNNAKVAQMLRQLAAYYQRDADCLYTVRIAQGLVHASKGTISFSPVHSHRSLLSPNAVAGLLTAIVSALDAQTLLLEGSSHFIYFLVTAIYPRFLVTLDALDLSAVPILVRVGQAVDVVGQAGKPKTITGFQTHTTPVLLAYGERAELATDEYVPVSPIMENFVIVKKNPNWTE